MTRRVPLEAARRLAPGLIALAALGRCSSPGDEAVVTPERPCEADVTFTAPHLGPGHEIVVRVRPPDGVPAAAVDLAGCLGLHDAAGAPLAATVLRRPLTEAQTVLLVDPGRTDDENARARALVLEVLRARPATERIAILRWGPMVDQVVTFAPDRAYGRARVEAGLVARGEARAPAHEALAEAAAVAGAGPRAEPALRAVVVIAPDTTETLPAAALEAARPALVLLVSGPKTRAPLPSGHRFTMAPGASAAAVASAVSGRLDDYLWHGHYGIGTCGDLDGGVGLTAGGAEVPLVLAPALAENRAGTCDAGASAAGQRVYPARVELLLTADQRRRADEIHARGADATGMSGDPREDFPVEVRVTPAHRPSPATAHFRGSSSFLCQRRNWTVNLDGRTPRFLMPGSAADKFHLISLCLDRVYLRGPAMLRLMAEEGLFFVPFDYVELVVNGESQGVYLITENLNDSVRRRFPGTTALLRRYPGADRTQAEIRWSAADPAAALSRFHDLFDRLAGLTGPALEQAARDRLDLDQYLAFTALMTLFSSGDYIDEVFFLESATVGRDGRSRGHFRIMGWDQDDIFQDCHKAGQFAFPDRHGLVYCAEADLDFRLFEDPHLYRLYVDALERVMARVTAARFAAAVAASAAKVEALFQRPGVVEASTELQQPGGERPGTVGEAIALLRAEAETLATSFAARADTLRERIAAFRAGAP